jgi:hypothetical protein
MDMPLIIRGEVRGVGSVEVEVLVSGLPERGIRIEIDEELYDVFEDYGFLDYLTEEEAEEDDLVKFVRKFAGPDYEEALLHVWAFDSFLYRYPEYPLRFSLRRIRPRVSSGIEGLLREAISKARNMAQLKRNLREVSQEIGMIRDWEIVGPSEVGDYEHYDLEMHMTNLLSKLVEVFEKRGWRPK